MKLDLLSRRTQFLGVGTMHRPSEVYYVEQILSHNGFKRIVEFGTGASGMMSLLFGIYALKHNGKAITFDIKPEPKNSTWIAIKPVLPLEFYRLDVFSEEVQGIVSQFMGKHKTLIYCDGGIKKDEFNMYASYLKAGDFIMAHDRTREIKLRDIEKTVKKFNLEILNEEYIEPLKLRLFCFVKRGKDETENC